MYNKLPNLVLGFHGCHSDVFKSVVLEGNPLKRVIIPMIGLAVEYTFGNKIINGHLNGRLTAMGKAMPQL